MNVNTAVPPSGIFAPAVADQALDEIQRLLSAAVKHHDEGNSLAASSSLIALVSVADPLIGKLREQWLSSTASASGEGMSDEHGIYL